MFPCTADDDPTMNPFLDDGPSSAATDLLNLRIATDQPYSFGSFRAAQSSKSHASSSGGPDPPLSPLSINNHHSSHEALEDPEDFAANESVFKRQLCLYY